MAQGTSQGEAALRNRAAGLTDAGLTPRVQLWIFIASFLTLITEGIGFGVRTGILGDWGAQFGFTKSELGTITGGGLTGFGLTIIVCSFFADRIGYKVLLIAAFILHVLSAVVTLAATPIFHAYGKGDTYWTLYIGMFMFALGNGLCEAAINPLVATLYPNNKTHYLNILHAGWPGGLVLGALIAYFFVGPTAAITRLRWEIPIAFFLVPTLVYGWLVLVNRFPESEAKAAGVSVGTQIATVFAPLLLFLFFIHALVGYVELGTDSWITNIMNNVIAGKALLLFIYISMLMFILRFFAGPIVHRINPLGLLFIGACCGALGLYLLGTVSGIMIVVAGTIFALGKTFYWPTMLGVIGERFPKGGALAMGISGGVGMLSAGLLGGPGIGYSQDYYASRYLKDKAPAVYQQFKSNDENGFLAFPRIQGLDGSKVAVADDQGAGLKQDVANAQKSAKPDKSTLELNNWFNANEPMVKAEAKTVKDASIYGGRKALQVTAIVPVVMALCYLLLVIYFAAKGGYKPLHLDPSGQVVEGPPEGIVAEPT